jgi:hypothetical protein
MGGSQSRPAQAKVVRPYLKNKLGVLVHSCDPSYSAGRGRRTEI